MISVPKEKSSLLSFIPQILKKIGHIYRSKIHSQDLRSMQYLGYRKNIRIVLSQKCF